MAEISLAELEQLNDLIEQAYRHGGDSGGGYRTNEQGLVSAMQRYARWKGWDGVKVCLYPNRDSIPQFVLEKEGNNGKE